MAVLLSPVGGAAAQFLDNNGNPLLAGKLFTYVAGTTTNQATYTSSSGVTPHTNPIILDAGGRVPGGEIWLTDGLQYKFVLKNANDVLIGTYDNLVGINSNFVNFLTETEVQTATAGQTVFTLTTMQYQPGTNNLSVFVDGVNQIDGATYSYVETSSTVVTFTAGLHVGALVKFTTAQTLSTGVTDASLVAFTGFNAQVGVVQDLAGNDGSDWIGFEPSGTGAVARSAQEKMRDVVSVKDFGAVGDGVADDTAAIQTAMAAANGKTLYFPSGTYKLASRQTFSNHTNTKIVGEQFNSIIQVVGEISAWFFDDTCSYITIDGMTFSGNSTTEIIPSAKGIETKAPYSVVQNCYIHNFNNGLLITSEVANNCLVTNNIFEDIIGVASGYGYGCYNIGNFNNIQNNTFINVQRHCMYFSGSNPVASNNCVFSGNIIHDSMGEAIALYANAGALSLAVKRTIVSDNIVNVKSGTGIGLDQNTLDCVVSNNLIYGGADGAMTYGIFLNGSVAATTYPSRNIVTGNYVSNAGSVGIFVVNGSNNIVSDNLVTSEEATPSAYGILFNTTGTPATEPEGNIAVGNKTVNIVSGVISIANANGVPVARIVPTYGESWFAVTPGSTTVNVNASDTGAGKNFFIANSSPTIITNFTGATDGQEITLRFGDSNTTITQANAALAGGVSFVSSNNDTLTLVYRASGASWFEKCRSIN